VGKSSLLKRLSVYFAQQAVCLIDLDHEIAVAEKQSIDDIFAGRGEAVFRQLEQHYFNQILTSIRTQQWQAVYIAVGAGFLTELPADVHCLWVRRDTDRVGRVFFDRPRLESALSPFDEFQLRARQRASRYAEMAHEQLYLPEGLAQANESEHEYFTDQIGEIGGCLTLPVELFRHPSKVTSFLQRRLKWGVRYFELRDDLLNESQIDQILQLVPSERILLALRKAAEPKHRYLNTNCLWDWPLEWAAYPGATPPPICSVHERMGGESLPQCLRRLEQQGRGSAYLKAAPLVHSFAELATGHAWAALEPKRRSFLPRSEDGRWRWYRLWMKNRMPLNFWREGDGSSADQPLLMEWLQNDFTTRWFAAILGDPVDHSWTPAYQHDFFELKGLPVLRIPISDQQWQGQALEYLEKMGLRYAAVTSPLKEKAYHACQSVSEPARKFQSVNTLRWTPQGWQGANTDETGLRQWTEPVQGLRVAVWGGGGTLGPLHAVLPDAQFYSARQGERRDQTSDVGWTPEVVIWAVGRSHMQVSQWPPLTWRPELVMDLNYAENSPGREYALRLSCKYQSGAEFFFAQADEQQLFWK
jgi:shikimate kinase